VGKTSTVPECDFCGGQPFFQVTANVRLVANGAYRVMAGTGDRFNLLDIVGGTCSPENLRACLLKGCTVKLEGATAGSAGAQFAVTPLLGSATYQSNATSCSATSGTTTAPSSSGTTCDSITQKFDSLVITCPSTVTCSGADETTTKKMSLSCGIGSGSEFCTPASGNDPGQAIDIAGNQDKLNWYFSVRVFDQSGDRRIFSTLAQATAYDAARLDDQSSALTLINLYDADPAKPASKLSTPDGAGWRYYFNHGATTTASATNQVIINGSTYDIFRTDERAASNSAVEMGCGFWNTMQPAIAAAAWDATTNCMVNTPCKAGKSQLAYTYSAKPTTGEPCLLQQVGSTTVVRSVQTESLVPPHIGKLVAYVASGQVSFGLTSIRVPGGGSNISLGDAQDFQSITEWLPVDKSLHACRHSSRSGTAPGTCK